MPLKIQRDDQSAINLTPMIDIVFLLIIFFMVGTKFTELNEPERDIALQVPAVTDADALTSAPRDRVINVYDDGSIMLDQTPVTIDELQTQLMAARQQYKKIGVVVRGDSDARYQRVAEVFAKCKKLDIKNLKMAVQGVQIR